jgi:hypothetical protein
VGGGGMGMDGSRGSIGYVIFMEGYPTFHPVQEYGRDIVCFPKPRYYGRASHIIPSSKEYGGLLCVFPYTGSMEGFYVFLIPYHI